MRTAAPREPKAAVAWRVGAYAGAHKHPGPTYDTARASGKPASVHLEAGLFDRRAQSRRRRLRGVEAHARFLPLQ